MNLTKDESTVHLEIISDKKSVLDKNKPPTSPTHSANSLLCGIIFGCVFSFLLIPNNNHGEVSSLTKNGSKVEVATETMNLAEYLHREVRVLCFMMTWEEPLTRQADIIMDTWAKRCNKFIFFSNKADPSLPYIKDVVIYKETTNWSQLKEAITYVYKKHSNDFDWILKVNDNSYVVMENLRHLLYQYDTDWPLIIGQRFLSQDYMTGVFTLSRRAMIRLIDEGFPNKELCGDEYYHNGDMAISQCCQHLNIIKVDGIDSSGRGQFFQNGPEHALFPERQNDYDKWYWHKLNQGLNNCCSDRLVAIQGVYNEDYYYMEYFIYKVHAFGRHRNPEPLPSKMTLDQVVKNNY